MTKILRFINSLGRSTITSNSDNYSNVNNTDRPSPHVDGKFDPDNEWTMVRPSIQVHVPCHSQILTKLWIYVPDRFKPQTAKIQITDSAEPTISERDVAKPTLHTRTISALISRRGQWLQIKLKQSIVPDTQLRIDFDRVDRNMLARLPEYFIYGKSVNGQSSFVGRGYFDSALPKLRQRAERF
ncbi:hypothetical protein [Chamaesiphon sp.]|uniref:hypothetical protein n=1 Tax=Chamaesiphon sp. TaxID=2814140 RepID=UPI00359386AD